jgi:hypothetical protein
MICLSGVPFFSYRCRRVHSELAGVRRLALATIKGLEDRGHVTELRSGLRAAIMAAKSKLAVTELAAPYVVVVALCWKRVYGCRGGGGAAMAGAEGVPSGLTR